MKARLLVLVIALTAGGLAGCRSAEAGSFLAPAQLTSSATEVSQASAPPATLPAPTPGAAPQCANDLALLSELTLPLGATVTAAEPLDKRWLVANNGSCDWQADYRLKPVAGIALGTPEYALFPARRAAQGAVRVQLNAPEEPGVYRGAWQAFDPQGNAFGEPLFLEIEVK